VRAKEAVNVLPAGLSEAAHGAPAVLPSPEPVELDPQRIRAQEIFDQVTGHLKREPTQSSRLLQSWIHSE
jgi:flagellar M-ring protein FliF